MRSATQRHRGLTAVLPSADLHQDLQVLESTTPLYRLLHGRRDCDAGIVSVSNKRCAHSATHQCPYLADSNSSLCKPSPAPLTRPRVNPAHDAPRLPSPPTGRT